jgi:hypothetical protein
LFVGLHIVRGIMVAIQIAIRVAAEDMVEGVPSFLAKQN